MKRSLPSFALCLLLAACATENVVRMPDGSVPVADSTNPILVKIEYGERGDVTLVGYLAEVRDGNVHPAVVLIHTEQGNGQDMRDLAMSFAREGYTALAVDLYEGKSADDGSLAANQERALQNVQQAVSYLRRMPSINGEQIASVGWSFGDDFEEGMAADELALDVSIIYDEGTRQMPLAADLTGDATLVRMPPPAEAGIVPTVELLRSAVQ